MKPGVYSNLSNADYHGGIGVSKSMLDVLADRSPLHLYHLRNSSNDNEPTAAQATGAAFHALLLEPDTFDDLYVLPFVAPEGALHTIDDLKDALNDAGEKVSGTKPELIERLKAVRPDAIIADELKHQYAITNAGRTILQPEAWEQLRSMRDAVMAHPAARALLSVPGKAEQSVYWNDPKTGELCRCRPDFWRNDGVLVDLKTTEDASPEGFARSIANWRYHVQHPFYMDGVAHAIEQAKLDLPMPRAFVFLAVEKTACVVNGLSKGVAVYVLDEGSVNMGRALYRRDLDVYARCASTNQWPGYGDKIVEIAVPSWEFTKNAQLLGAA